MSMGLFKKKVIETNAETDIKLDNGESREESQKGLHVYNQRITIDKLSKRVEETGFATDTLIGIISNISKNVEQQVDSINNVIDKIENYSALAEEVYARTSDSQKIAGETLETAQQGNAAVDNIIKSMNGIESSVEYIKEVITSLSQKAMQVDEMLVIIKDIASQTNLLSLNASIEAARAGEHGRGFAVVADEVRKLAQKSNESVDKISKTIKGIKDSVEKAIEAAGISSGKVKEGADTAADTINAFKKIIESINTTAAVTGEISSAISEQTNHLGDVITSADDMKKLSEKVMSMIEVMLVNTQQTKSSIEMLNQTSKDLADITGKILMDSGSMANSSKVLKTNIARRLETMDPALSFANESSRIFANLHKGLLAFGLHADVIPAVAKSWYVEEDNVTWVFNLRKGAKFHNGREITGEDVKYSLERILSPALKSANAWFLEPIDGAIEFKEGRAKEVRGIKVLDRYRISIRLASSNAGFLLNLSQSCDVIIAKEDVEKGIYTGCGPYSIEDTNENKYILTAFNDYFGGKPYVDRIEITYGDTNPIKSFIEGKYSFVILTNTNGVKDIKNSHLAQNLKTRDAMTTQFLGFNLKSNSVFVQNRELRKAINYAVNKKRIVDEVQEGLAREAKGVFPPSIIDNSHLTGYPYSPEKAKMILQKEGFYNSSKRLVILGNQNNTGRKTGTDRMFEYVMEDLKAVGIECDMINVPPADYLTDVNIAKCDLFTMGWIADTGDPDNYLEPLFKPNIYTNFTGYNNKEVTKLMEQAKAIINPDKRINLYKKIQDIIIDDAPWVFLYHPITAYACSSEVSNLRLTPMSKVRFDDIIVSE